MNKYDIYISILLIWNSIFTVYFIKRQQYIEELKNFSVGCNDINRSNSEIHGKNFKNIETIFESINQKFIVLESEIEKIKSESVKK